MGKLHLRFRVVLVALVLLISCNKREVSSPENVVRYEISGVLTGDLNIQYQDNVSGDTVIEDVASPWSIELRYNKQVTMVGIEVSGTVTGNPGQVITLDIYVNNTLAQTHSSVSGRSGLISIPLRLQEL